MASGSDALANWTIGDGGVGYRAGWQTAEGDHCLHMNFLGSGSIQQTILTNQDKYYRVTFALAGNPGGTQGTKRLGVSAAGQSKVFTFDTTGKSIGNMGWTIKSWTFRGGNVVTTLKFDSFTSGDYGPVPDKVRVTGVESLPPLPLLLD